MKINLFNNKSMHSILDEVLSDDFVYDALHSLHKEFVLNSKDNKYELTLSLPGYNKQDIDVSFDKNVLYVRAEQSFDTEYLSKKSMYKSSFYIPERALLDSCAAEYKDGILKISFDFQEKNPNSSEKRIEVK
jgi:HSP20 family protein